MHQQTGIVESVGLFASSEDAMDVDMDMDMM
jgi:hypothetical protein